MVFEQTLDDIEYIFVDDCSTDNSVQIIKDTLEKYPSRNNQVQIIHQTSNGGPSRARNVGLRKASGEYVILCDSDDYLDIDAYEVMYAKAIQCNANRVVCGIELIKSNGVDKVVWTFGKEQFAWEDLLNDFTKIEGGINSSMCNKLIKRTFLLNLNIFFDENTTMWEDLYTTLRIRYFAKMMYVVDRPLYHYCLHLGSVVHSDLELRLKSQIRVVELIEQFFIEHNCHGENVLLISYLKLLAKSPLIGVDHKRWFSIFPEAKKYIFQLRKYYGLKKTLKYLLLGYGQGVGCATLEFASRIKRYVTNIR